MVRLGSPEVLHGQSDDNEDGGELSFVSITSPGSSTDKQKEESEEWKPHDQKLLTGRKWEAAQAALTTFVIQDGSLTKLLGERTADKDGAVSKQRYFRNVGEEYGRQS